MIIGIDLGTTNSVAAIFAEDGPQLVPNALGETLTPSIVALDSDDQFLVGRAAQEYSVNHPERSASNFKRYMGTDWTTQLGKHTFSAADLSSFILRALKEDCAAHLGEPIERAVITVPAYFNDEQRLATMSAGRMAGLQVERIINEPTAAAIAYGFHESDEEKQIVVFDLGGGTFDISVVEMFEGAVEVRASSGECFLGGEDFTASLAGRIITSRGMIFERAEFEHPAFVSRLLYECEVAKRKLSKETKTHVRIPDLEGDLGHKDLETFEVTQESFAEYTESILARVEMPIRRGLGDSGLQRTDIDEVILVGGATRMPSVVNRVREMFETEPQCRLNPDEVVALGAAVQAGLISQESAVDDLVVTDVAPFTLGVSIVKQLGADLHDGYFLPIINRNTTIPISRSKRVGTIRANQREMSIELFQGESRKVKDNLLLGKFTVTGIPRGPSGQEVDIRVTYDQNGIIEVEAEIVATQRKCNLVITRYAKGLSEDDVERAVLAMSKLKTHPREHAKNRFLIKRAERVYRELPLHDRDALSELLDGFEEALDHQEAASIEQFRNALEEFLDAVERGFSDFDDEEF